MLNIRNKCEWLWSLNFLNQLLIIYELISLCGDVKTNPGPNLETTQTFESYENQIANLRFYPKIVYFNTRSVNNKHEEVSIFLQQQYSKKFLIIAATWINDKQDKTMIF